MVDPFGGAGRSRSRRLRPGRRGADVPRGDARTSWPDGSQRIVDVTILPIRDEAGRVLFLAPTGTDVTERKRLEDNLRRLAADLSEADRRKDEFLAMLAHELRNPLAPIRNAVQVLRLAGRRRGGASARRPSMLERQVRQMARGWWTTCST